MSPGPESGLLRPAEVCRRLLAALEATEGRRRRRKRNTTPDSLGMAIKQQLLEEAVRDDPDPDSFEGWLLSRCAAGGGPDGPVRAMALDILADWRLARSSTEFRSWLEHGAPSDDQAASGSS